MSTIFMSSAGEAPATFVADFIAFAAWNSPGARQVLSSAAASRLPAPRTLLHGGATCRTKPIQVRAAAASRAGNKCGKFKACCQSNVNILSISAAGYVQAWASTEQP